MLVCPITPEAEPAPVLALDVPPAPPVKSARARKNAKRRAREKEKVEAQRIDGGECSGVTRNDRKKKTRKRREAEARAAVRAVVSPDERAGGDLAAHVAEGVGPPPQ